MVRAQEEVVKEVVLREWQTIGPKEEPILAGCRAFSAEETINVAELARRQQLEVLEVRDGIRISTRSYVGGINLGPLTLHIRPKLAELSSTAMAVFLRYALGFEMVSIWNDTLNAPMEKAGFVDLIALALLDEINALLRAGLLRNYATDASWLSSPRGRLDLMELAQHPMRMQTALALPCRYSDRTTDTTLNRLVQATLNAVRLLVSDAGIAFDLHARSKLLNELCKSVPLTRVLCEGANAELDRRSQHYRQLVVIAEIVLEGIGVTLDDTDQSLSLSSFLLDMNRLFEQFITRLVIEYGPANLRLERQESHSTVFRWQSNTHRWLRPRLRPDIVIYDASSGKPRLTTGCQV
jgi:5-methylcytosine-specific restriction enzyme subunit McrC